MLWRDYHLRKTRCIPDRDRSKIYVHHHKCALTVQLANGARERRTRTSSIHAGYKYTITTMRARFRSVSVDAVSRVKLTYITQAPGLNHYCHRDPLAGIPHAPTFFPHPNRSRFSSGIRENRGQSWREYKWLDRTKCLCECFVRRLKPTIGASACMKM